MGYNSSMRKLLLVYNPRSSRHEAIREEVLTAARGVSGWMVGKYAISTAGFEENVASLMRLVEDGDLVITAGGDGTAMIVVNALMKSGKDVALAALGYGNFNDIATMWGEPDVKTVIEDYEAGRLAELSMMEVRVNGALWRYSPCYFTMGLLAEASTLMEEEKMRRALDTGKKSATYSLVQAVKWYLKYRRGIRLPVGKLNGAELERNTTDYLAVMSPTMAKMMKGGEWWQRPEGFGSSVQALGKFWKMVRFGLTSVRKGVPLTETKRDVIEFAEPSTVQMQTGGEYERMEGVSEVIVGRTGKTLKVVVK